VMFLVLRATMSAWAQSAEGEAVLKAREAALLARDLNAVLNLFADDALVVTSSGRIFMRGGQMGTGYFWLVEVQKSSLSPFSTS